MVNWVKKGHNPKVTIERLVNTKESVKYKDKKPMMYAAKFFMDCVT
jgi:hypothetical protein